jgi:2-hydroxy-3-keto-5-methylthiopentenyl-1-phosphate phosphatase
VSSCITQHPLAMLILCDFDGTITEVDVTDLLWKGRIPPVERKRMVDEVDNGHWTMHEYIAHGYSFVPEAPRILLDELRSEVRFRAGFADFLQVIQASNNQLQIVSNGLDFYIREFLPEPTPIMSFVARFDGRYRVELPQGCVLLPGEEFKVNRVRHLIAELSFDQVVYIGDGRADFAPSLFCDTVFAVRDSRLAQLRESYGLSSIEFDTFDTVTDFILSASSLETYNSHARYDANEWSSWET